MSLKRKTCDLADFKLSEEGVGSFQGHASTFGNRDRQGEIVVKGAFSKSLDAFKRDGFIAVAHDWDALPVASIRDCYEDEKGLWIDCEFHSTPEAQKARAYVRERLERRKSVGLSIGYFVQTSLPTKDGLLLQEIDVREASIVSVPANPAAGVSRAKALKAQYLGAYTEEMMTWGGMDQLWSGLQSALYDCLFMEPVNREENLAAGDACLAEFHALALKLITALYPDDPAADLKALAAQVKSAWKIGAECRVQSAEGDGSPPCTLHSAPCTCPTSDPPAGKEFDRQIEDALADVADLIRRSREIAAMRAKSGRTLSAARREDLAALHTSLSALLVEVAPRASDAELRAAELNTLRRKHRLRAGDLPCH